METESIFSLLIGIVLLLIVIYGYVNALKPENARWYYISVFNKIILALDSKKIFFILPLFPPIIKVKPIELTWSEYKKTGKVYHGEIKEYENIQTSVGVRKELTHLRELEEHPIIVNVILADGYRADIIIDVVFEIFDPMKILPLKDFLIYAEREFIDIVSPWANKKRNIDNIMKLNIETFSETIIKNFIAFQDDLEEDSEVDKNISYKKKPKSYQLRSYLNEEKFIKYGFKINELSLKIGLPQQSIDYFEIKQRKKKEEAEAITLEAVELRKQKERIIFKNDADVEREIQQKDLDVTAKYQKTILNTYYQGRAKEAASYKAHTLFLNTKDSKEDESVKRITDSITANLITKHKLEDKNENKTEK